MKMIKRAQTDVVQLSKIRMREGLRKNLERQAEINARPLNGEIVHRLEQSFDREFKKDQNTAVVETLAGPSTFSATLLRWIAYELQANPKWHRSPEKMAERLGAIVQDVTNPTSPTYGGRSEPS
jgi:hypothetical protein